MLLTNWQTNFASGEISPHMYGRTDLKQYDGSCRSIKNFIPRPQGGVIKRPGTVYVAEVKDSSKPVRLFEFEYSTDQAYVLEVGEGYIRFYKDGGQILSTAAISNGTFTTDLTDWTDGDTGTGASTQTAGVMRLNGGAGGVAIRTQAVSNVGTNQYTLTFTVATNTCVYNIGTTSGGTQIATGTGAVGVNNINFTPTTAGTIYVQFTNAANNDSDIDGVSLSTPAYQIENPYLDADLDTIHYTQSFDKLYLAHNLHPVKEITRTAHSAWTITDFDFQDGPYFPIGHPQYGGEGSGITLTPAAATGTTTMTASAALFVSTDVGRLIRFRDLAASEWGWGTITGFTSSTVVDFVVERTLTGATASLLWTLGAFSETTGYPRTIQIHESRMIFGGTKTQQQTVFFSASGDFNTWQPDNDALLGAVDDDTAMTYTIGDGKSNVIRWLESQKLLFLGTSGPLFAARPSSTGEALTPTTLFISRVSGEPSGVYPSISADTTVIYPHRLGRKLVEIRYTFAEDSYNSNDLAILSEARTEGKIKWLTKQSAPNSLIWGCTEDGKVFSLTYIKDQNVLAWAEHVLGGTDVAVKSLVTIPGTTQDETWFLVSRTIDGGTKQYIEFLSPSYIEQAVTSSKFLDCNIAYSGGSTTSLSGLDHLEGETVEAFSTAGYKVVVTEAVDTGAITVSKAVTGAIVGLPYTSSLTMMQPHIQGSFGDSVGKVGRPHKIVIRFYNSYGGKVGISSSANDVIPEYSSETVMDGALILFSGDREFSIPSNFTLNPIVYIEHSEPVPCNVLGLVTKLSVAPK